MKKIVILWCSSLDFTEASLLNVNGLCEICVTSDHLTLHFFPYLSLIFFHIYIYIINTVFWLKCAKRLILFLLSGDFVRLSVVNTDCRCNRIKLPIPLISCYKYKWKDKIFSPLFLFIAFHSVGNDTIYFMITNKATKEKKKSSHGCCPLAWLTATLGYLYSILHLPSSLGVSSPEENLCFLLVLPLSVNGI